MTKDEYIKLYEKYLAGQCTPEEEDILKDFQDDFTLNDHSWDTGNLGDRQELEQQLLEQLQQRLHAPSEGVEKNNMRWLFWRSAVAFLMIGLSDEAMLVNKLRTRVGADLATSLNLQGLLDERARELSWEGWSRNDLFRFDQFGVEYPVPNDIFTMNKDINRRLYPIPSTESKTNPNLKPNPGY